LSLIVRRLTVSIVLMIGVAFFGCLRPQGATVGDGAVTPKTVAFQHLKAAVQYKPNPVVRVAAVEALESSGVEESRPWIRSALNDEHPAVRFAACMAIGRLRDPLAESMIEKRLDDPDSGVRVAAIYARHRLGRTELSGRLATYLLTDKDVSVRRNAALALGLLGERGAIKLLAKTMRDEDPGVRQHVLEALARLGNPEARQELTFMTNAGLGSDEVFAIAALAGTGERSCIDTFRYKLANATHLETKLAAARGLGQLGVDDGFDTALRAITSQRTLMYDPNDPPDAQRLRARQMACAALGAIGREEAMAPLMHLLERSPDPRVQVSAAGAILEITRRQERRRSAPPFPAPVSKQP